MNINNILIVSPRTPGTYWNFQGVFPFLGIKSAHGSLALITLAALFPKRYLLRLIDMNTNELLPSDIAWADAVFITGWDIHRQEIAELVRLCVRMNKPVVVGGSFATVTPDAPELKGANSVFVGEAIEHAAFSRLLSDLEAGSLEKRYVAARRPSLNQSPIPRFDLWNFRKFADATIQFCCGCPFHCEFCAEWKTFGAPRYKEPAQVIAELQALHDAGYRGGVFVVDDNFIGIERSAWNVTQAILGWQMKHGFPFGFYGQSDLRLTNNKVLAQLMASAGFRSMFIGLESPSDSSLSKMGKKQNVGVDVAAAFTRLRGWGIEPQCGLMIGNEEDDKNSFSKMEEFVRKVGAARSMLGICVAMEGTDLHERANREGRLMSGMVGDQFKVTNIRPKHMSLVELVAGHRRVLDAIYDAVAYFERSRRGLRELKPVHQYPLNLRELRAAGLSVVLQGILAPYRAEYWKFMLGVALDDPRKLGRAFAAAVVYAHFYGYTRELREGLGPLLEQIIKEEARAA
jgi:radical SAM superfamily enzyme YgiQ (UPF0313 family)